MVTLALDSASKTASVALLQGEDSIAELFLDGEKQHGSTLLPAIAAVLSLAGCAVSDIDLFVCTVGPGSFTGLRVGIGTAKGLARSYDKPLVGVSSLEALAVNVCRPSSNICPMLDARRGEVYAALYRPVPGDRPVLLCEEQATRPDIFVQNVTERTLFIGDGAVAYRDTIEKILEGMASFADPAANGLRAVAAGRIGLKIMRSGDIKSNVQVVPRYLRPSYVGM